MGIKQTEQIIKALLSDTKDAKWREAVDHREANKAWLMKSAKIAIKINRALRDQKLSQKDLAVLLKVKPQQVNKILKGRENLKLETISKLEKVLEIELVNIISQTEIEEQIASEVSKQKRIWQKSLVYVPSQKRQPIPKVETLLAKEISLLRAA